MLSSLKRKNPASFIQKWLPSLFTEFNASPLPYRLGNVAFGFSGVHESPYIFCHIRLLSLPPAKPFMYFFIYVFPANPTSIVKPFQAPPKLSPKWIGLLFS